MSVAERSAGEKAKQGGIGGTIQVVIQAMGLTGSGIVGDLPLIIAFAILAAYTYTSGLRAPAMIAVVKDLLIYITIIAAVIVIPAELGGFGKIFAAVDPAKLTIAAGTATNWGGSSGGGVNFDPTSSNFGKVTSKGSERNIQLSLRFYF